MSMKCISLLVVAAVCLSAGCSHRSRPAAAVAPAENEFLDLTAGGHLSITVPSLKSGGYITGLESVKEDGRTLTVTSSDPIGFEVSRYAIEGKADGRVRLKFESAEMTRNGRKAEERRAPKLPFDLPGGYRHIRLIYFVRSSQADHNMAIAASKNAPDLDEFTRHMKIDPQICKSGSVFSCVWVPSGVAVRAE